VGSLELHVGAMVGSSVGANEGSGEGPVGEVEGEHVVGCVVGR
jgi:hypothetical protein